MARNGWFFFAFIFHVLFLLRALLYSHRPRHINVYFMLLSTLIIYIDTVAMAFIFQYCTVICVESRLDDYTHHTKPKKNNTFHRKAKRKPQKKKACKRKSHKRIKMKKRECEQRKKKKSERVAIIITHMKRWTIYLDQINLSWLNLASHFSGVHIHCTCGYKNTWKVQQTNYPFMRMKTYTYCNDAIAHIENTCPK